MEISARLILAAALLGALLAGVRCQRMAVDMNTSAGTHVVFPFFSRQVQTLEPKLREYFVEDMGEILALLKSVIGDSLRAHSGLGIKSTYRLSALVSMGRKQEARRKPLQRDYDKLRAQFNVAMFDMFAELMKRSDERYKQIKSEPKAHEALADDFGRFVDDLREAVTASPAAVYMDFGRGRMGDVSFMGAASALMARLELHGFGKVFWAVRTLLSLIKSLS